VPVKVTVPSPVLIWFLWSPQHSRDAYPDIFDLFADAVDLVRDEARALAALGCTYIQIDAPDLGTLADPEHVAQREATGQPLDRLLTEGVDMVNAVADVPGVIFGLHLCKGNFASKWISAGGYDSIAEAVFKRCTNYDVFLLEYEDERSGSFEPLSLIPDDKVVALGLVSSKTDELEPAQRIVGRIDEAAKHHPKDQLAVSTQCGFASVTVGANLIGEQTQEAKLRLVADVAEQVWG
jgi:5-methyltetrahydropteroyltriglutamate--homocysteine methyltransferase